MNSFDFEFKKKRKKKENGGKILLLLFGSLVVFPSWTRMDFGFFLKSNCECVVAVVVVSDVVGSPYSSRSVLFILCLY